MTNQQFWYLMAITGGYMLAAAFSVMVMKALGRTINKYAEEKERKKKLAMAKRKLRRALREVDRHSNRR